MESIDSRKCGRRNLGAKWDTTAAKAPRQDTRLTIHQSSGMVLRRSKKIETNNSTLNRRNRLRLTLRQSSCMILRRNKKIKTNNQTLNRPTRLRLTIRQSSGMTLRRNKNITTNNPHTQQANTIKTNNPSIVRHGTKKKEEY